METRISAIFVSLALFLSFAPLTKAAPTSYEVFVSMDQEILTVILEPARRVTLDDITETDVVAMFVEHMKVEPRTAQVARHDTYGFEAYEVIGRADGDLANHNGQVDFWAILTVQDNTIVVVFWLAPNATHTTQKAIVDWIEESINNGLEFDVPRGWISWLEG